MGVSMITILGFLSLPASNTAYQVVKQDNGKFAVQNPDGTWLSIQPNGSIASRPNDWPLGGYELATLVPAGLRYDPIDGASYLLPAVQV
jgi:hypothetical protein